MTEAAQPVTLPAAIVEDRHLAAAAELMAGAYEVIPRSAANGHLAGRKVLVWTDDPTEEPLQEILNAARPGVVMLMPDGRSPAQFRGIPFDTFKQQHGQHAIPWTPEICADLLADKAKRLLEEVYPLPKAVQPENTPETLVSDEPDEEEAARAALESVLEAERASVVWTVDPDSDAWAEPVDIFGGHLSRPVDLRYLPQCLADWVGDVAERMGVDPSIPALGALVACAGVADDNWKLQPTKRDTDYTVQPRLWGAVVGESSDKKSPALAAAMKAPEWVDAQTRDAATLARKDWAYQMDVWRDKRAQAIKQGAPEPAEPEEPRDRKLVSHDMTTEGARDFLLQNPKALLFADELSGWIGSFDAYRAVASGKDRAFWLQAYNGGRFNAERAGRSITVPNASACILGGITEDSMRMLAGKLQSDGLLQRMMIVCSQRATVGEDRAPNVDAMARYKNLIREIYNSPSLGVPVALTSAASDAWQQFAREMDVLKASDQFSPPIRATVGKYEGLAARLMLVCHLAEHAAAGTHPAPTLDVSAAERACNLIRFWLLPHMTEFWDRIMGGSEYTSDVMAIAGHLLAKGRLEFSMRDLRNDYKRVEKLGQAGRKQVMTALEDMAIIRPKRSERSRTIDALPAWYEVNPRFHEMNAEHAQRQREGRAAIRRLIYAGSGR